MRICAAGFLFPAGRPEKQPAVDPCGDLRPRGPHPVTPDSCQFCEIAVSSIYYRSHHPVTPVGRRFCEMIVSGVYYPGHHPVSQRFGHRDFCADHNRTKSNCNRGKCQLQLLIFIAYDKISVISYKYISHISEIISGK